MGLKRTFGRKKWVNSRKVRGHWSLPIFSAVRFFGAAFRTKHAPSRIPCPRSVPRQRAIDLPRRGYGRGCDACERARCLTQVSQCLCVGTDPRKYLCVGADEEGERAGGFAFLRRGLTTWSGTSMMRSVPGSGRKSSVRSMTPCGT